MNYFATILKNLTFKQIDNLSSEEELIQFEQLRYDHPLIFVEKEKSIIFFNIRVKLDQARYDLLYHLVDNATHKKEQKGLSPLELFKLAKCRHTRKTSRNEKLTPDDRADERIRSIKAKIKKEINEQYDKQYKILETAKKVKEEEELKKGKASAHNLENMNAIGIYEFKKGYRNEQYFNGNILIDSDSPYCNFEINSAINLLIQNQKNKDKKYTTEFLFKK